MNLKEADVAIQHLPTGMRQVIFIICPSWCRQSSEDDRIISLLQGLYGYFGFEDNDTNRRNYARLAHVLTSEGWAAPTLGNVLGSSAWRSDSLQIQFRPIVPRAPARTHYFENGNLHQRLSANLPVYQGPDFQNSIVPFRFEVLFSLDEQSVPRPAPFTPPITNVLIEFNAARGGFRRSEHGPGADYSGANTALHTNFPTEFTNSLTGNGTLHLRFKLIDPDTGITRVYDDVIQVITERIRDIVPAGPERYA